MKESFALYLAERFKYYEQLLKLEQEQIKLAEIEQVYMQDLSDEHRCAIEEKRNYVEYLVVQKNHTSTDAAIILKRFCDLIAEHETSYIHKKIDLEKCFTDAVSWASSDAKIIQGLAKDYVKSISKAFDLSSKNQITLTNQARKIEEYATGKCTSWARRFVDKIRANRGNHTLNHAIMVEAAQKKVLEPQL